MRLNSPNCLSDNVLYQNYQYQQFKRNKALFYKLSSYKKVLRTSDSKKITFFVHDRFGHSMLNDVLGENIHVNISSTCAKIFLKWYYRKIVPNQPQSIFALVKIIHSFKFPFAIVKSVVDAFYRVLSRHFSVGSISVTSWANEFESLRTDGLLKLLIQSLPRYYFEPICYFSTKLHFCLNTFINGVPFVSQWKVALMSDKMKIFLSTPINNVVFVKQLEFNPIFRQMTKSLNGMIQFLDHKEIWLLLQSKNIRHYLFINFDGQRLKCFDAIKINTESSKEETYRSNILIIRNQVNRHCNISHQHTYVRPCLLTFSRTEKKFNWVQLSQSSYGDLVAKSTFKGCYSFYQDILIVMIPQQNDTCHRFLLFALHPISLHNLRPPKLIHLTDYDSSYQSSVFDIQWNYRTDVAKISYIGYHGVYFQTTDLQEKRFFPLPSHPISYAYDSVRSILYYPFQTENSTHIRAIKYDNGDYFFGNHDTQSTYFHDILRIDSMNDTLYLVPEFEPPLDPNQTIEHTYKCHRKISTLFCWSKIIFHTFIPNFPPSLINN